MEARELIAAATASASAASVYPELDNPYRYDDTQQPDVQQQPPSQHAYQEQGQPIPLQSPVTPPSTKGKATGGEVKPRLRKACDSCSVRKVKCDESGPPCKSCASLDIPCTFNRPSRRRGPPNRHAEQIKRQRLDDGSYNPMAAPSPTAEAAYGLAALSAPMPVHISAESICDIRTLSILIDDYFTYIHPLIPIPHEPTFRAQFARREDQTDKSFLALLATMIEALVASFPRRVKQIFTSPEARQMFPHATALINRCHFVFTEARGKGFLDRPSHNIYDACATYLAGLSFAYMFDLRKWRFYCSECIMILRTEGYHRPEMLSQEDGMGAQQVNHIEQQIGRRVFWLCFVGAMSIRQLGSTDSDIIVPHAHSDALPPLPVEVDDRYITSDAIFGQPQGELSEIVGFNYNIRIYRAFHSITAIEMAVGTDKLFDWEFQRNAVRNALREVKAITANMPLELRLGDKHELGEWPPRSSDVSQYLHLLNGRGDPTSDQVGLMPPNDPRRNTPYPRRTVQFEVQKANIYGTQLATRSYLVERYWNLYEIHQSQRTTTNSPRAVYKEERPQVLGSPTVAFMASGFEDRFQPPRTAATPSESMGVDEGEQQMGIEREDIVKDLARLLKAVNQVNMEPNGHSLCHKIRQVASTLLNQDRLLMSSMPNLNAEEVQKYLRGFIDILTKLERIGSSLMRGGEPNTWNAENGQPMHQPSDQSQTFQGPAPALTGITAYAGKTQEDIEEEELVQWASLKEHQERFVNNGYLAL